MIALALLGCGCGRLGYDPAAARQDGAAGDGVAGTDATAATDAPSGPFAPPVLVPALSDPANDDDPALSPDGLELYFASDRPGLGLSDLWRSVRSGRGEPWPAPSLVTELSTPDNHERSPFVSRDGLTIWFDRGTDVFVATRASPAAPWSTPAVALDTADTLGTPSVCDGGLRMFLRVSDGGIPDLYATARPALDAPWAPYQPLTELNTADDDSGPDATADCQRLYFDSNRDGPHHIFVSELAAGAWGPPRRLDELGASASDPSLTPDERLIVFTRTQPGEEIWEATR